MVCKINIDGLLSYMPVFGFTNIVAVSVICVSHTASPRVTGTAAVSHALLPRFHVNFNFGVPGSTLYAL